MILARPPSLLGADLGMPVYQKQVFTSFPYSDLGSIFDSWSWRNRKWLVLGGTGLVGLSLLGLAGAFLK